MKGSIEMPMKMMICLKPPPTNRPRIVKRGQHAGLMKPKELSEWLLLFWKELRDDYGIYMNGQERLMCPVKVRILFVRPRAIKYNPAKHPDGMIWCPHRPDVDNNAKVILDALTEAHLWHDDAQVVSLTIEKAYAERGDDAGIEFSIEEAPGDGPQSIMREEP